MIFNYFSPKFQKMNLEAKINLLVEIVSGVTLEGAIQQLKLSDKFELVELYNSNRDKFNKYFLLVICIGTMQFTTNYTFKHMPVGYALSLFQLSIIISVVLGHKIFKEEDIRKKLIGSTIMIAGSIVIILLKNK